MNPASSNAAPAALPCPEALQVFHPVVQGWFRETFSGPTKVQQKAWPQIAAGQTTLLLAPTGSGKTLAAFMVAINRLMFPVGTPAVANQGVRVLYLSPLKALGVDVERNLRAPLAGVRRMAQQQQVDHHVPTVGVRSGDTSSADRQQMRREPPEILITTPESLFLLLTSRARETLTTIETVIVDEIHSMVRGKRGAHLFVSLERLEQLRRQHDPQSPPLQRIGLSATQQPLDEVARLLAGGKASADAAEPVQLRPVTIVEAGRRKQLELTIEVPVEDMAQLAEPIDRSGPAAAGPTRASIWPSIHPRLVDLIRRHRSTMIFVNSRRLAERLTSAINELAAEELAAAHHGSVARDQRVQIEDRLKIGTLPAIVATSSLELGIDMGAVDLVIQIEAPPSIASGLQRIGRAGHQVDAPSTGIIFPKFRGDLLACSAAVERMMAGEVEATYYPRNPLDILAQQIVAMVALEAQTVDQLYTTVRGAAPFFELPRNAFDGILDLLSGRYPSDEFAELRPRVNWDRVAGVVSPRRGTQRLAIANAGTIPDRGTYGVFLADGSGESGKRVGELDEEMVFETRAGDVFLLGASSWRAVEITHDRVLVTPAPGEPAKMPFWRGDGPGRPLEFGRAIGSLSRRLSRMKPAAALQKLVTDHRLDVKAAQNLVNYLHDQVQATGEVPSDTTIVVESFLDEVGDWRVVVMTPFGGRVHAPWAMAAAARLRDESPGEVDFLWNDDGMVFRLPESDQPPAADALLPSADEIEDVVVRQLGTTALFATHFRENAGRALLLPKRQPGRRTPLWLQRRKAADLLKVAARHERFPIVLETYRECLRDVFDLTGLKSILTAIAQRTIRVRTVETKKPSPFAATLLFNYTANYMYDGDAPLAERKAATLALDHTQLRQLLGDAELRELLDADVVAEAGLRLQRLDGKYPLRHADAVHDCLLALGELTAAELAERCEARFAQELTACVDQLVAERRIILLKLCGEVRYAAAEDAARYRDALGTALPLGLPEAFLQSPEQPLVDLVSRYARTHAPFKPEQVAQRWGIGVWPVLSALHVLAATDRVLEGEFTPGERGREWCDAEVLRALKRRSLASLRKQVEPVEAAAMGRFLVHWQGITRPRRGLDGLLDTIEQLQGAPIPASVLESAVLPARVAGYRPAQLDELCMAGEVVWRGLESLGTGDGRIALYLTDKLPYLAPSAGDLDCLDGSYDAQIVELLTTEGALFFDTIQRRLNAFPHDLRDSLWRLIWSGRITNDTLAPMRSLVQMSGKISQQRPARGRFRSRRQQRLAGSEGRWSIFAEHTIQLTPTERQTALATQLVERYGIVTRQLVASENILGGFAGLYPVLKAMEEAGRLRRGYFIAGQGAAQFAAPGAEDRLREPIAQDQTPDVWMLAATDPANPYGGALRWPDTADVSSRPQRSAGARVILRDGQLIGYLSRTGKHLMTFLTEQQPQQATARATLIDTLRQAVDPGEPLYLERIDGQAARESTWEADLIAAGFVPLQNGLVYRGERPASAMPARREAS